MSDLTSDPTSETYTQQDIINSIAKLYPEKRQTSKQPTFLLTYLGGVHALTREVGLSFEMATKVFDRYHSYNHISMAWGQEKLQREAYGKGYVVLANGLKLRTTALAGGGIYGASSNPKLFHSKEKTVVNAFTQSYGMVTITTLNHFLDMRDKASNKGRIKRNDIMGASTIHDSNYFLVNSSPSTVWWFHEHYHKAIAKYEEDYPELRHPIVKIDGDTELYYPTWADINSMHASNELEVAERLDTILFDKDDNQLTLDYLATI